MFDSREDTLLKLERCLADGDFTTGSRLARKVMRRWPYEPDGFRLAGEIALAVGEPVEGERLLKRALKLDERSVLAWIALAECRLELSQSKAALDAATHAVELVPNNPDAVYTYATALELNGLGRRALEEYRRAHELEPETYFVPARVDRVRFDALTRAAVARLPEEIRHVLSNVEISVKDIPDDHDTGEDEPPLSPLTLGVFLGVSRCEQSVHDPWSTAMPARIVLYQRNLERACASVDELAHQIEITVFHEVGHFLGLTEEELHDRGLG